MEYTLASFDTAAVRKFAEELELAIHRCDNGEGAECASLDSSINHYVLLLNKLRDAVRQWARTVYAGKIPFEQVVEDVFKKEARHLLQHAKRVAANGRLMNHQCFELAGLDALHFAIADLDFVLDNWVRPQLSVGPAPRVKLPKLAEREAVDRLAALSSPDHAKA